MIGGVEKTSSKESEGPISSSSSVLSLAKDRLKDVSKKPALEDDLVVFEDPIESSPSVQLRFMDVEGVILVPERSLILQIVNRNADHGSG